MRNFVRPVAYDLVLNLFTSFGYFNDKEDDMRVLRNIHVSLKPTGVCLFDMISKEWLAKHLQVTTSTLLDDGSLLVKRIGVFDDWAPYPQ